MMIVERARRQHSTESGQVIVTTARKAFSWLASKSDSLLHSLQFMAPATYR